MERSSLFTIESVSSLLVSSEYIKRFIIYFVITPLRQIPFHLKSSVHTMTLILPVIEKQNYCQTVRAEEDGVRARE